jgi:hypothetical protein
MEALQLPFHYFNDSGIRIYQMPKEIIAQTPASHDLSCDIVSLIFRNGSRRGGRYPKI